MRLWAKDISKNRDLDMRDAIFEDAMFCKAAAATKNREPTSLCCFRAAKRDEEESIKRITE